MQDAVSQLVAAVAFGQQLLIFHLHSADHMGVKRQFHRLLQGVIAVSKMYPEEPQSLPLVKGRHDDGDRDAWFSIGEDREDDDDEAAKRSYRHVVVSGTVLVEAESDLPDP
ncbi:hypothetical protein ACQ4PT_046452 [Festuca glaucescens]